ncbi:hypothetical protein FEM48_Zijuj03G0087500 [Ziziphus jujuba var. spinosa]|uniref:SANT domain-containing protein n=1 Tax=Ziziphus jujuba var. spinosa TaxID=714518 RepID=A0A978VPB6_ZIZJJ|nr:uncharacterized protein LOC107413648 isoform X1 [Ziziphus jujuba var. spinosa]KAH7537391.1 hypothetical protein FEM48_Zijuj03G0087500 [Ziziphus jujuba var. spinosa]
MPPEPLPWDRKDFFRERKHERSESLGSVTRWRDSSHHGSRELNRWATTDFRRPPGHGRPGGLHMFSEEPGHGYAPSRSSERMLEDENWRPSISRGEGKYGRNNRENRGSYNQRDWKGHLWETANGSPNTPGRVHDVNNELRTRDDLATYSSHSTSDFGNTWDQFPLKDQQDKIGGSDGLGTGQKSERDNSLGLNDWKPLKWTRSGSLSSRGSGFSHSSSSKSIGAVDSNEAKVELQTKNATPVQSPSGDATACVTSAAPSEETTSRKKPRLGWGEGLAKYEKKKVEGPDVSLNKQGASSAANSMEHVHSLGPNLADKSPRVMGFSDCASPATPSSVACSSSPGVEEKSFGKAANNDNDISNLCGSPGIASQDHVEGFSFNLEKLDSDSIINLGPSITELLQSDDANVVSSCFMRSSAMSKLLIWKGEISKKLEVTESEIDLLENELKSLKSETGVSGPCPAASSSLPVEDNAKSCTEQDVVTNLIPRPAPLQVVPSGNTVLEEMPMCNSQQEEIGPNAKDEDVDSPGTVTSKLVEPPCLVKAVSPSGMLNDGVGHSHSVQLTNSEVKFDIPNEGEQVVLPDHQEGSLLTEGGKDSPVSSDLCSIGVDMVCEGILTCNRESSNRAFDELNKLLPRHQCKFEISGVGKSSNGQNDSLIKEKFAMRKRFLKFKERVITLKFKAFQHLWKEDMRLLSIRKCRAKSQKKFELSLRSMHGGYQKHRSSIRSRFSSPAGNLSLVPTTEILNFTSKLLLDSQVRRYRNTLKMPALILDKKEKVVSRFISSNGLVEDPCAVEKERAIINPWTPEEKEIFMDKLATFGKDFRKISSFLDHKTTADCVEFYYKNHKSDCFEKTRKKLDISKQGKSISSYTYLVPSGKKWNREMNAASLDILGAASVMAAHADGSVRNRQAYSGRLFLGGYTESKTAWGDNGTVERPCSFDVVGNERETVAADVLAGICGSLSSENMSSCITSSADPAEGYREWKCQRVESVTGRPLASDVTQIVDEETCSDESCGEMDPSDWTDEEKSIFIRAVSTYGKDFAMISQCVGTKSRNQCKVFFSKARKCLGLDLIHSGPGNDRTSMGNDANGGGSGYEGACILETGSGICGDKLGSKMDEDLAVSVIKRNNDECDPAETLNMQTALRPEENNRREQVDRKDDGAQEMTLSDVCHTEDRPKLVSDSDSNTLNGVDRQSEPLSVQRSEIMFVNRDNISEKAMSVAESVSISEGNEPEILNPEPVGIKSVDEVSSDRFGNNLEGLEDKSNANIDGQCALQFISSDSNSSGNASHLAADRSSSSGLSLNYDYQQHVSVELNSMEKSCVVSMPQETSLAAAKCVSVDSAVTQAEKPHNVNRFSSKLDFQEGRDMQCNVPLSRDESYEHLRGLPLSTNVESSQVLRGYPLQMPTKKGLNGDISCRNLSEVQKTSTSDRNSKSHLMMQECYLQKCNSSKAQRSFADFPLMSQKKEQAIDHSKTHTHSLSDSEKPSRNGDFKLFGKILSNPSSLQKANSSMHENVEKGTHQHKSSNKSSNLRFTSHHNSDGNTGVLKFDHNNFLGLENVPMRSYGFWDGNRIQTAYPSMPESAILLAKYPAAFSNFPTSSSKVEQQPLQTVVKSNERNVNGVSVFPTRDISSSNGVVDYQVYRSRDGTKAQPFTVDVKQRPDIFSEMQRRNGFDAISSLQQQGRGMVGMNVVGRGGILVGGPCTGVSDPVAAIKMHYAKSDQYVGQASSIIREDESWRGKGDIGR